jgi:hypothetical protein
VDDGLDCSCLVGRRVGVADGSKLQMARVAAEMELASARALASALVNGKFSTRFRFCRRPAEAAEVLLSRSALHDGRPLVRLRDDAPLAPGSTAASESQDLPPAACQRF